MERRLLKLVYFQQIRNPGLTVRSYEEYSKIVAISTDDKKLVSKIKSSVASLSKEGRDFLLNKLLNTDPTKRLKIHEKNDYLGLEQSTPKPMFTAPTTTEPLHAPTNTVS